MTYTNMINFITHCNTLLTIDDVNNAYIFFRISQNGKW